MSIYLSIYLSIYIWVRFPTGVGSLCVEFACSPLACVGSPRVLRCSDDYCCFVEKCYFAVSAHAQRKLVKFRQGVQTVKVRAKLLSGAYKSNTEVKFRQAITDGYDKACDLNIIMPNTFG